MPNKQRSRTDDVILSELEQAVAAHHEGAPGMDGTIKALREELAGVITEGANPCPNCGNMPHGIKQNAAVKNMPISIYEIGCLVCRDRRSQSVTREGAVENWNNEIYIAPNKA
jgi:hypothetical protein